MMVGQVPLSPTHLPFTREQLAISCRREKGAEACWLASSTPVHLKAPKAYLALQ